MNHCSFLDCSSGIIFINVKLKKKLFWSIKYSGPDHQCLLLSCLLPLYFDEFPYLYMEYCNNFSSSCDTSYDVVIQPHSISQFVMRISFCYEGKILGNDWTITCIMKSLIKSLSITTLIISSLYRDYNFFTWYTQRRQVPWIHHKEDRGHYYI